MSKTPQRFRVTNPTAAPITYPFDSVEYTIDAGDSAILDADVARHLASYFRDLILEPVKVKYVVEGEAGKQHRCPYPDCDFKHSDAGKLMAHVKEHVKTDHEELKALREQRPEGEGDPAPPVE